MDHAIRFTTDVTDRRHVWPARHDAGSVSDPSYPPMGARFRLKAVVPDLVGYRADTQVVLQAMKRYGLVLADNGSPWYFQGTADDRWPSGLLDQLKTIPASAFEAVDTAPLRVRAGSAKAAAVPPLTVRRSLRRRARTASTLAATSAASVDQLLTETRSTSRSRPARAGHPRGAVGDQRLGHRAGARVVPEGHRHLGVDDVVEDLGPRYRGDALGDGRRVGGQPVDQRRRRRTGPATAAPPTPAPPGPAATSPAPGPAGRRGPPR